MEKQIVRIYYRLFFDIYNSKYVTAETFLSLSETINMEVKAPWSDVDKTDSIKRINTVAWPVMYPQIKVLPWLHAFPSLTRGIHMMATCGIVLAADSEWNIVPHLLLHMWHRSKLNTETADFVIASSPEIFQLSPVSQFQTTHP